MNTVPAQTLTFDQLPKEIQEKINQNQPERAESCQVLPSANIIPSTRPQYINTIPQSFVHQTPAAHIQQSNLLTFEQLPSHVQERVNCQEPTTTEPVVTSNFDELPEEIKQKIISQNKAPQDIARQSQATFIQPVQPVVFQTQVPFVQQIQQNQ